MHVPSAQENAAYNLQRVIKVRGGNPVYAGGELPNKDMPDGAGPRFTLYEDLAGHKPLCSVAQRAPGMSADIALAVIGPGGAELGVLRLPTRGRGWRPPYEMAMPDGTNLVGRRGTISAWVFYVLVSPLLLIFNVAGLLGGYGRPDWYLPTRTAWRTKGGLALGLAPVKFYGMRDKYKVRSSRLDLRVVYAQAVLHDWSS
ncbi:hypothetical protein [Streptomyces bicolor]|uniref:hypothetical protein n=1 Tax=Streptomyces bicolor TaxID=66874 RepID=UPI0004E11F13|nr:hypothetical protein [Streptomyces bicolor]